MEESFEYKIVPPRRLSLQLGEVWRYRELFYFFTWRDVKVKYKQAVLGIAWAVLQPFLLMVVFTAVFHRGLNIQPSGNLPYPVFAFSGLLIWQIFSGGLSNAANSMLSNANIIKKIYFPRLIIPLSAILTAVVDFFFALIVFLGLLFYYKVPFHPLEWLMLLTLSLFLAFMATAGLSLFLAAWNVKYRDFQYVIPFLIQVLFFVSPVLYEPSQFEGSYFEFLLKINPMSGAIHLSRAAFTAQPIDWVLTGWSALSAGIFFVAGLFTFRKMEAYFADFA